MLPVQRPTAQPRCCCSRRAVSREPMTESRYPQAMAHYLSWPPGPRTPGSATLLYIFDIVAKYGDDAPSEIHERPLARGLADSPVSWAVRHILDACAGAPRPANRELNEQLQARS